MNHAGISEKQAVDLGTKLNDLLANYAVYYQNLRGFHWNITGINFFELHNKFEELYVEANEAIDEIAERIRTLGAQPLHTFTDFVSHSVIKEAAGVNNDEETVRTTLQNIEVLLGKEREILSLAAKADDEGTVALMSDYIKEQEKVAWMLSAYLK